MALFIFWSDQFSQIKSKIPEVSQELQGLRSANHKRLSNHSITRHCKESNTSVAGLGNGLQMLIRGPSAINRSVLLRYDPIHMIHAAPFKRIQNHPQYLFNMDDYTLPHRCAFPSGALWINQEQTANRIVWTPCWRVVWSWYRPATFPLEHRTDHMRTVFLQCDTDHDPETPPTCQDTDRKKLWGCPVVSGISMLGCLGPRWFWEGLHETRRWEQCYSLCCRTDLNVININHFTCHWFKSMSQLQFHDCASVFGQRGALSHMILMQPGILCQTPLKAEDSVAQLTWDESGSSKFPSWCELSKATHKIVLEIKVHLVYIIVKAQGCTGRWMSTVYSYCYH